MAFSSGDASLGVRLERRRTRPRGRGRRPHDPSPQPSLRPARRRAGGRRAHPDRHPPDRPHARARALAGAGALRPRRAARHSRRGLLPRPAARGRRRRPTTCGPARSASWACATSGWSPRPTAPRSATARGCCSPPPTPVPASSTPRTPASGRSTPTAGCSSTAPTCSSGGPTSRACTATTRRTWSATATDGWSPPAPGATSTATPAGRDATVAVTLAESDADLLTGRHVLDTRPLRLPTDGLRSVGVWDPHLVRDRRPLARRLRQRVEVLPVPPRPRGRRRPRRPRPCGADPTRTATEGTTLAAGRRRVGGAGQRRAAGPARAPGGVPGLRPRPAPDRPRSTRRTRPTSRGRRWSETDGRLGAGDLRRHPRGRRPRRATARHGDLVVMSVPRWLMRAGVPSRSPREPVMRSTVGPRGPVTGASAPSSTSGLPTAGR